MSDHWCSAVNNLCNYTTNFYDSNNTLFNTGIVTSFINAIGFCVIMSYTSTYARLYKIHLLMYQALCSFCDVSVAFLVAPVFINHRHVPHAFTGLLSHFNISAINQYRFLGCIFYSLFPLIFVLLYHRLQALLDEKNRSKIIKERYFWLILMLGLIIEIALVNIAVETLVVTPVKYEAILANRFPCVSNELSHVRWLIYGDDNPTVTLFVRIMFWTSLGSMNCVFVLLVAIGIQFRYSEALSETTRRYQRKLLLQLLTQLVVPFVLAGLPLILEEVIGEFNVPYFENFIPIAAASHGAMTTMLIVLLTKSNRDFFINLRRFKGYRAEVGPPDCVSTHSMDSAKVY